MMWGRLNQVSSASGQTTNGVTPQDWPNSSRGKPVTRVWPFAFAASFIINVQRDR